MISAGDSKIGTATLNCQYHTQILTVQILSEWNCAEEFTCAIFQYNIILQQSNETYITQGI